MSTAQTPPPVTNLFDKTSVDSAASFMNLSSSEAGLWPYNTISVSPALYLEDNKLSAQERRKRYELQKGVAEVHPRLGQILNEISRLSIQNRFVRLDRPSSDGFDQNLSLASHSISRTREWDLHNEQARGTSVGCHTEHIR